MKRYLITSLIIGGGVVALVAALYFLGAFRPAFEWLSEVYSSRGVVSGSTIRLRGLEIVVYTAAAFGMAWAIIDIAQVGHKVIVFLLVFVLAAGLSPTLAMYGLLFEPFSLLSAIFLASAAALVYSGTEHGMRKRVLEGLLGSRVSHRKFLELLEAKDPPEFAGVVREVTVVSCRLFNHEEMRGKVEPGELTKMNNLFLRSVSTFLLSRGAYLDESSPDLVRVFFGILEDGTEHQKEGCSAALELKSRLRNLSRECESRWFQKLHYGIGVSTGPAAVGVYGTRKQYFFGGTGEVADFSQRLAQANRRYGSEILLSPKTYETVQAHFEFRPMDMIYDPESDLMTEVYELLALEGSFSKEEAERRDLFWKGLIYLREKKYDEALDHLSRSRNPGVDDSPTAYFLALAQEGISSPEDSESAKIEDLTGKGHARLISSM